MPLRLIILLPSVVCAGYAVCHLNWMPDLFIYREGARLGWRGESPYSPKIAEAVATQFPDDQELRNNCGYFLPPMAVLVLGPFAALPWETAKLVYAVLCLGSVIACWYGATFLFRNRPPPPLEQVPLLIPWLVCLHPVLKITFDVGQTTILAAGAVALGQMLHTRGWRWLGALLWACVFVKPHVALTLLPLAWYLDGWRRMAMIVLWLAILNLIGCMLAGGSPLFAFDYLHHLAHNHKDVIYNRIDSNPQITSWNCLLGRNGGPHLDLSLSTTLAGYAVFLALIVARCIIANLLCKAKDGSMRWPTPAWAVAIGLTMPLVVCQVLAYEAWMLVLAIPFILECLDRGRKLEAYLLSALLILQILPFTTMAEHGMAGYRTVGILLFALVLLARPNFEPRASATEECSGSSGR